MAKKKLNSKVKIKLIKGVDGWCLAINDIRICGNKPWAGGTILQTWTTTRERIEKALESPCES